MVQYVDWLIMVWSMVLISDGNSEIGARLDVLGYMYNVFVYIERGHKSFCFSLQKDLFSFIPAQPSNISTMVWLSVFGFKKFVNHQFDSLQWFSQ